MVDEGHKDTIEDAFGALEHPREFLLVEFTFLRAPGWLLEILVPLTFNSRVRHVTSSDPDPFSLTDQLFDDYFPHPKATTEFSCLYLVEGRGHVSRDIALAVGPIVNILTIPREAAFVEEDFELETMDVMLAASDVLSNVMHLTLYDTDFLGQIVANLPALKSLCILRASGVPGDRMLSYSYQHPWSCPLLTTACFADPMPSFPGYEIFDLPPTTIHSARLAVFLRDILGVGPSRVLESLELKNLRLVEDTDSIVPVSETQPRETSPLAELVRSITTSDDRSFDGRPSWLDATISLRQIDPDGRGQPQ